MAQYPVTLSAVWDDVANTLTISGQAPPPPQPPEIPLGMWWGQVGPGFETTVSVRKSAVTVPTAVYAVPGSNPVEKRLVEYRNGAWQMPGVVYTGT